METKRLIHQRQGYNDCALAAAAMLTGRPLAEVTAEALAGTTATSWHNLDRINSELWRKRLFLIWSKIIGRKNAHLLIYVSGHRQNLGNAKPSSFFGDQAPDIRGRGIITLQYRVLETGYVFARHAVAYSGNKIYDGNFGRPYKWLVWKRKAIEQIKRDTGINAEIFIEKAARQKRAKPEV